MVLHQNIKLVVFDFDGTLFHLAMDWDRLKEQLDLKPNEKLGDAIQRYRHENHQDLQKVTNAEVAAAETSTIAQEVIDTLVELRSRYDLAILTRNSRHAVESAFRGTSLEGKIFTIGREDAENLKPHTEGLEIILAHFNIRPRTGALIGDTYHDVEAAHRAGLYSIIIRNDRLKQRPASADAYIENIADLTT